jgi:hypothetical protein
MNPTASRWVGWCWHRGAWRRVATGESLGECARCLSATADHLGVADKFCVMTTGAPPPAVVPQQAAQEW